MLQGNFKLQDAYQGKVHEWSANLFVPEEESAKVLAKMEITLQVSPNATESDMKNNIMKNCVESSSQETLRS
eukprot:4423121-Ditylum_brightwellii.AAC.1